MLASALGNFSFSFSLHGPGIFYEPMKWRLDEKLKRALFTRTISHFCRSQAMVFCPPQGWDHLHIVHCAIDPDLFTPRTHNASASRLLYVGRLASVKGLPILLQAIAYLRGEFPDLRLTVVGDGPDRQYLTQLTTELALTRQVDFLGYQNQTQVRQHLANTDIFVSSSFAEGVPVVLMEAMAAGVPTIATRIAGVSELIDDGTTGYLTPPGDVITLAQRLRELLSDTDLRQRFATAARAKVQRDFAIHTETAKLHDIFMDELKITQPRRTRTNDHTVPACDALPTPEQD
jgi:glycosyltransferase involved in cell wall biosynthesis